MSLVIDAEEFHVAHSLDIGATNLPPPEINSHLCNVADIKRLMSLEQLTSCSTSSLQRVSLPSSLLKSSSAVASAAVIEVKDVCKNTCNPAADVLSTRLEVFCVDHRESLPTPQKERVSSLCCLWLKDVPRTYLAGCKGRCHLCCQCLFFFYSHLKCGCPVIPLFICVYTF